MGSQIWSGIMKSRNFQQGVFISWVGLDLMIFSTQPKFVKLRNSQLNALHA